MADKYIFDTSTFKMLRKTGSGLLNVVRYLLRFLLVSFSLTAVSYIIFALIFSTDTERRLRRENKMYQKVYPTLLEKDELLSDAVAGLQYKDNSIYEQVFHANAPSVDPMADLDVLFASDTIPDVRLTKYTREKADDLMGRAARVEADFEAILRRVADPSFVSPPMVLPLKDVTYPQVGASTGMKMNPFYKAYVQHSGLDLIVPRGTPVFASADGEVIEPKGSVKSDGKVVAILHPGGYITRYSHLDEVFVSKGQKVSKGRRIGTVGMSGNSYAPHLHYEVQRDSAIVDPVNYVFASVSPQEYANMLYMAVNTMQSMD